VTAIEGAAEIQTGAETVRLAQFETALVAGATGAYRISAVESSATLLRASVPV